MRSLLILAVLLLPSCYSAPKRYDVQTTRTTSKSPVDVGRNVVLWCGSHGFAVESANENYIIAKGGAQWLREQDSVADCGSSSMALKPTSATINVVVKANGTGSDVTVLFLPVSATTNQSCNTTGKVEEMIFSEIR